VARHHSYAYKFWLNGREFFGGKRFPDSDAQKYWRIGGVGRSHDINFVRNACIFIKQRKGSRTGLQYILAVDWVGGRERGVYKQCAESHTSWFPIGRSLRIVWIPNSGEDINMKLRRK